jgi:copper chaperone CopZ
MTTADGAGNKGAGRGIQYGMASSTYTVTGMHCVGCETKIRASVERLPGVVAARPHAPSETLTVETDGPVDREAVARAVDAAGDYTLGQLVTAPPAETGTVSRDPAGLRPSGGTDPSPAGGSAKGYRALAILVGYIAVAALLADLPRPQLAPVMANFMGGFFLAFSFFKFLDLKGFASGFARYDILAERWKPWGYIYPFVELALGLAYLTRFWPPVTFGVTVVVLGFGAIGVIRSLLRKDRIKCACLGTVIDLPLGTVTLIEDLGMAAMGAVMLAMYYGGGPAA